jgi:hypothetical protein
MAWLGEVETATLDPGEVVTGGAGAACVEGPVLAGVGAGADAGSGVGAGAAAGAGGEVVWASALAPQRTTATVNFVAVRWITFSP